MSRPRLTPALPLLAVPLLLVGYVLSIGPAARVLDREQIDAAYAPLLWVCDGNEFLTVCLFKYLVAWGISFDEPAVPMSDWVI